METHLSPPFLSDGSNGGGATPLSPAIAGLRDDAMDLEAAEDLILRWDLTAASIKERMLFDGGDRFEAETYLRAVDEISRAVGRSPAGSARKSMTPERTMQIAMVRLEEEFRHILASRVNNFDVNSLIDLGSLSLTRTRSDDRMSDLASENAEEGGFQVEQSEGSSNSPARNSRTSYRSTSSIHEIDIVPTDAADDLRSIAVRMIGAGYGRECFQVYGSSRKSAVEVCFRHLGVERLSIGDVQKLDWDAQESKIRRWIRASRVCFRIIFASERRLCDHIFDGLSDDDDDTPFCETVRGPAVQLLSFAEAISIGRRSPEKLFKTLDLHDALTDLLPDIDTVFNSRALESISTQVADIIARLAEAIRGILSEFENAILRECSKVPVPGGTIHPLTRYVMNYISLISDYKQTLIQLITSRPPATNRNLGSDSSEILINMKVPEPADDSPLASHLIWIIFILQFNIENKTQLYSDVALSHIFLMNNLHYIVQKVIGSVQLQEMIGDDYPRKLKAKYRQLATTYERATWAKVLYCLRDEGLHVGGTLSSSVPKSTLRDRFKAFNSAFDEIHRTQATWSVPESRLKEELRISILEKLLPAYRSFLGRFRHHLEGGRHPDIHIKYSVEDLETALSDLFEGCPPHVYRRRKSQ